MERFCLFVGYPRSGHSLVGALLDGHPNAMIAHELQTLRYVRAGIGRNGLFHLLAESSRRSRTHGGRAEYEVPGQWQGRAEELRVIGDKAAWGTTLALRRSPDLLDRLQRLVRAELKVLHVVRNPFDVITRMAEREEVPLGRAIDHFFELADTQERVRAGLGANAWLDLSHEALIEDPHAALAAACDFLGLPGEEEYLDACAELVFSAPRRSRDEAAWTGEQIARVLGRARAFRTLARYTFEVQ